MDWLTSGSGIFHISGKLGSGKSTLMKFLCESSRLSELLSHWANGKELVIVNFFFWRAGNKLQKSLDGLVRSLLHDLLKQRPDLIPSTLPLHWRNITSLHLQVHSVSHISTRDVQSAFHWLVSDPKLYEKHSFCVFVDGLDEYDETPLECDYDDITTLLLRWAKDERKNVKFCVSSRDLPPFSTAFSPQQRIKLQDLTRIDVENFIRARFRGFWAPDQTEEDAGAEEKIVSEIADKASGVFLWVALVLKTLREGYRNGDRLTTLLRKIDDMPEDIERLYEHLLRSIPKADRVSAYRTFAVIMRLVERDEMGMSLMQYSFLEDFEENPMFGVEAPVSNNAKEQCEELPRLERAHNRLRGQCKGLLEVKSDTELIAFAHRSVYDFFLLKKTKRLSELHLRDFDTVDAISQTYLAELKLRGRLRRSAQRDIRALLSLRKLDNSEDIPPYHFLESLRNATLQVQGTNLEAELSQVIADVSRKVVSNQGIISVFYTAVEVELLEYVSWVLDNDFAVSDNTARFQRVFSVIMEQAAFNNDINTETLAMVLRFLKQGRLINDETVSYSYSELPEAGGYPSVWEQCITSATIRMDGMCEAQRDAFGEILEILLKGGLKSE